MAAACERTPLSSRIRAAPSCSSLALGEPPEFPNSLLKPERSKTCALCASNSSWNLSDCSCQGNEAWSSCGFWIVGMAVLLSLPPTGSPSRLRAAIHAVSIKELTYWPSFNAPCRNPEHPRRGHGINGPPLPPGHFVAEAMDVAVMGSA